MFRSRPIHLLVAAALFASACAPLSAVVDDDTLAVEEAAADAAGRERATAAAQAESERIASEEAASEAAAIAASESEAAALAAEEAASEAAAAAKKAAEEAARKKAAKEAAEKKAAEEAARKKAAEEAARKKAAEEAAAKKAAEEADKAARAVQTVLKDLGYYTGAIDGDIGPNTKTAIKDFQAVNGLTVDGRIGKNTQAMLDDDDALPKPPPEPESKSESDDDGDPDLPAGEVLPIADAKRVLKDMNYYGGSVDGKGTDGFRTALTAFQKVEGIAADGSLGPQTSAHLRNPRAPSLKGGSSSRIEIDLTRQVLHVVKNGTRIRTMPTSSGNGETYTQKDGDTSTALTPVGDFRIERRISGLREADLGSLYDPLYFYRGFAIHGSNSVPSYPASHGCTRVSRTDILWLADQMPNGTQVRVYGGEHTFSP